MNAPPPIDPQAVVSAREGYDRWADFYDGEDNPLIAMEEHFIAPLIEPLTDLAGRAVLDIGCGTGRHAVRLARVGAHVVGVDFSAGMLQRARDKAQGLPVTFLTHDLGRPLPLRDEAYHCILSCLVLEHIADLGSFFGELRRLCHHEGVVVISAMHPAMMLRGVSARFTDPATGLKVYPQSHPQQLSDYVMAAVRAGFGIDHLSEHAVDDRLIATSPRAERYRGWPMLFLMRLRRAR